MKSKRKSAEAAAKNPKARNISSTSARGWRSIGELFRTSHNHQERQYKFTTYQGEEFIKNNADKDE